MPSFRVAAFLAALLCTLPAAAQDATSPWTFKLTPYGWFIFMSGQQTVRGRTVTVDTNTVQMFPGALRRGDQERLDCDQHEKRLEAHFRVRLKDAREVR